MPPPSTIAGDITAFFSSAGVIGATIVTWKTLIPAHREIKAAKKTGEATHEIVNSQRTAMQKYIELLQKGYPAGTFPADKSLEDEGS